MTFHNMALLAAGKAYDKSVFVFVVRAETINCTSNMSLSGWNQASIELVWVLGLCLKIVVFNACLLDPIWVYTEPWSKRR